MKFKRKIAILVAVLIMCPATGAFVGCGAGDNDDNNSQSLSYGDFDPDNDVVLVTRESGSGTHSVFIELFGIEAVSEIGNRTDMTSPEAEVAASTGEMLTMVQMDPYTLGFASYGAVHEPPCKTLKIDGVAATMETIQDGSYPLLRTFNLAVNHETNADANPLSQDFISFILSAEGQDIISVNGYKRIDDNAPTFESELPEGRIIVAGSSSVSVVMAKLKEAYEEINPNAQIHIQESDSTSGMNAAINNICDIGMSSRELNALELETLTPIPIAADGIALVVNYENPVNGLTSEHVRDIYIGDITKWNELLEPANNSLSRE